jgi:enoyl-CoA hydratase/carnithine racemase
VRMLDIHIRLHKDILWLVLDRQPLNPLTREMLEQLTIALKKASQEKPRLLVLTSMGERAFSVGVEVPDDSEAQRIAISQIAREMDKAFCEVRAQGIKTAALIKGSAFRAGCELMTFCETIIARDDAEFRLPSITGKIFPSSLAVYLPELLGQETTARLSQSGETLSARKAWEEGLVHQVISRKRFVSDSEELLVMLASVERVV